MAILVNSRRHGMIPFAHRLKIEGHKVVTSISKDNYRRLWDGKAIDYNDTTSDDFEVVVSDIWGDERVGVYGTYLTSEPTAKSYLRLGWWQTEEGTQYPHLLIYDLGAWPGNMGRLIGGGLTLVHLSGEDILGLVSPLIEPLEIEGHLGLVEADLVPDENGDLSLGGYNLGWNWLQAHAFVGPLENLGELLLGQEARFEPQSKFVSVLPVSIPPWPEHGRKADTPTIEVTSRVRGCTFWHDVVLDMDAGSIIGGGSDGLLGVVRGAGNHPDLAADAVLTEAREISVPELQWRPDVGRQVTAVLNSIEKFYGVSPWL